MMSLSVMLGISMALTNSISSAEVIQLPEQQAETPKTFSVTLPGRGMTMTEVIEKFGEPVEKQPEVGEPPITRWVYPNYVVIFEYQYVIHSLSTNKPMGFKRPDTDEKPTEKMDTLVAEPATTPAAPAAPGTE